MAEILRLNAIIQTENMKGNMFVFSILRTWQNIFEVFQLIKNVRIIVHKKEELMKYESEDILPTNICSTQKWIFYKCYNGNLIFAWIYQ